MPRESAIDARIEQLETTTFAGQRLTRRKLSGIQETVAALPLLSRTELAHTICEYLGWRTPRGRNRQQLALRVLEEMERLGLVRLPAKRHAGAGANQPLRVGAGSAGPGARAAERVAPRAAGVGDGPAGDRALE